MSTCDDCRHKAGCQAPCAPVERELRAVQAKAFMEKEESTRFGETIVVVYPPPKELHFSSIVREGKDGNPMEDLEGLASTERPLWGEAVVTKKLTGIFLDRLVNRLSWEDLAVKYDCKPHSAYEYWLHGMKRVMALAELLDKAEQRKFLSMQERNGRLSDRVKAFLLYSCFDMTSTEIARYMGKETANVSGWIRQVSAEVRAGRQVLVFEGDKGRSLTMKEARARA